MLASILTAVTMRASDAVNQHMNKKNPKNQVKISTEKDNPKPRLHNIVERRVVEPEKVRKKSGMYTTRGITLTIS